MLKLIGSRLLQMLLIMAVVSLVLFAIFDSDKFKKQIAVAAFGQANILEDPNLFYAVAIVQPGHTPEEVTTALIVELDR